MMNTPYDVDPQRLIDAAAERLEDGYDAVAMPEWAQFAKSGVHNERPPRQDNWWYVRSAAVLRKIYVKGPLGTERLRTMFGGRKTDMDGPEHFRKASGKTIRTILQQLEEAGLVETVDGEGRALTAAGQSFLDNLSEDVGDEQDAAAA
jgi:small subunit ribosomal protein S19e